MANAKKGQTVRAPSWCGWWKHFRKDGKRMFWKKQRAADKRQIKQSGLA